MRARIARALGNGSAALVLTAAALGATAGPAGAAPQPMGQCTTSSGVVLAVDFSRWGGPVYRSCGTTPTTGYELLNQGGWRTTGTGHDGPAFICRIGYSGHQGGKQYPPPEQEDCVLTPPAAAYWSYWHAGPGQNTWEYSRLGAMLYKPGPGSVDLWVFGSTDVEGTRGRPTLTPDQLRAHNARPADGGKPDPAPAPRETRTADPLAPGVDTGPAPRPTAPVPPVPAPAPAESSAVPSPVPEPVPVGPSPSAPQSSSPGPAASGGAGAAPSPGARVVEAAPAAEAAHDAGSFLPAVVTGALVVLIGGAALHAAKRRRRTE
ncbi:hypothetical protein [Streptomyces sp. NPDC051567]|uniref:hypothetical protein n=1 Tax=Streptomyces sp. NPDC051567 TaxID=3365660 RepID=UPI00379C03C2